MKSIFFQFSYTKLSQLNWIREEIHTVNKHLPTSDISLLLGENNMITGINMISQETDNLHLYIRNYCKIDITKLVTLNNYALNSTKINFVPDLNKNHDIFSVTFVLGNNVYNYQCKNDSYNNEKITTEIPLKYFYYHMLTSKHNNDGITTDINIFYDNYFKMLLNGFIKINTEKTIPEDLFAMILEFYDNTNIGKYGYFKNYYHTEPILTTHELLPKLVNYELMDGKYHLDGMEAEAYKFLDPEYKKFIYREFRSIDFVNKESALQCLNDRYYNNSCFNHTNNNIDD